MNQTVFICAFLILCPLAYFANAKDPIADHTARFYCNNTQGQHTATVDINSISVRLPDQEPKTYNFLNKTHFTNIQNGCAGFRYLRDSNSTVYTFFLNWDSVQQVELEFRGNSTVYFLNKIVYKTSSQGQLGQLKHTVYQLNKPDLKFPGNELKVEQQGYKCANLTLTLTDIQTRKTVTLDLVDFMFFAFQNGIDTSKITRIECRHKPASSLIPIIVGGGLLLFAAVVVGIYFVMRKKRPAAPPTAPANK